MLYALTFSVADQFRKQQIICNLGSCHAYMYNLAKFENTSVVLAATY